MSQEVKRNRQELEQKYIQMMELYSDPYKLSLALENDEAKIPLIDGPWIWDVVIKYFPLVTRTNWMDYAEIVKKAVRISQERGVHIGIVPMQGKLTKREKEWMQGGFWWRVQKFLRVGRLTKKDARRLQEHRYSIITGISKGGIKVLKASGYGIEEAKIIFFNGSITKLAQKDLLPEKVYKLEKKISREH